MAGAKRTREPRILRGLFVLVLVYVLGATLSSIERCGSAGCRYSGRGDASNTHSATRCAGRMQQPRSSHPLNAAKPR